MRRGDPLYYAVTGPDRAVVLALDAATLNPDRTATPLAAGRAPQVLPVVNVAACRGKGVLGVQVPPGSHTVSVFPADGGGPLASQPLTVTER